jgi:hypothetical protein
VRMRRAGVTEFLASSLQKVLAFSLLFSLSLVLLYALGNYQGFLDSSQLLLLDMVSVSLWASCLCAAAVLLLLVVNGIRQRRFGWLRFLATLLALAFSSALVAGLGFLTAWIQA